MYLSYSSIVVHVHLILHCSIWKWGPNSGYPVQRDLIAIGRNHGAGCVFINGSYGGGGQVLGRVIVHAHVTCRVP